MSRTISVDLVRIENGFARSPSTPSIPRLRWYFPSAPLVGIGVGAHGDVVPRHRCPASSARTRSTAFTFTTIFVSNSNARIEVEILVRRPREAVVTHDAIGDEVTRSRRDVVHRHLEAERVHRHHRQLRVGVDGDEMVLDRQVRALASWDWIVGHVLPPATGEEAVVAARDQLGAVLEGGAEGRLVARRPVVEYLGRHVAAVAATRLGAVDDVAGSDLGQALLSSVGHEDLGLADCAVGAGMGAAAVGVDGVAEGHPGGGRDLADDALGVDVKELQAPELAGPDVAVDQLLVGEEGLLAAALVGRSVVGDPPAHTDMIANVCSPTLVVRGLMISGCRTR